jgi:hypothetical protein
MLIKPDDITLTARISEDELRQRMATEVMQSVGALDETGKPLKGVQWTVHRGDGRAGGYTITVRGPMPARLLLPRTKE